MTPDAPTLPKAIERVVHALQDAAVVADDQGRILAWNARAAEVFGYTEAEALGMNIERIVPQRMRRQHRDGMRRMRQGVHGPYLDSRDPIDVPGLRKDGEEVAIEMTLSDLHDVGPFVLGVMRETTKRHEAARRQEAERTQLAVEKQALEAFAYLVSHDLKEPVRAMGAYLQLLRENLDAPDRSDLLDRAARNNENLGRLLQGLLRWSRAAAMPLEPQPVDLRQLLEDPDTTVMFRHALAERNARLLLDGDFPRLEATPDLLRQVFGNLITNAIRHNPRPDPVVHVRLGTKTDPGFAEILVDDNGPGFSDEVKRRVASTAGPRTLKTGFGLLIAKRAIERLGGTMVLDDAPGGGGRVHLYLPVHLREKGIEQRVRELV